MTIAFDVLGGSKGVEAPIQAVNTFLNKNLEIKFILVGNEEVITKYLDERIKDRIEIVNNTTIASNENGLLAARKQKSSMKAAIQLVADRKADIVISAGDSGVYLTLTTLILKRLKSVKRPAFMALGPTATPSKKIILLDVGANLEATPEMIVQWAKIGTLYAQKVYNINNPKVGLVNIGEESYKGFEFHANSNKELEKDDTINYFGFIEPNKLMSNIVDIAVGDGYSGNMALKSYEGAIGSIFNLLKTNIKKNLISKLGFPFFKKALTETVSTLDYRKYGGSPIVGLKNIAIKAHGSSDKEAFLASFRIAVSSFENNINDEIEKALSG